MSQPDEWYVASKQVMLADVLAYVLRQHKYPIACLLLGFVLGPILEEYCRRALSINDGNPQLRQPLLQPADRGVLLLHGGPQAQDDRHTRRRQLVADNLHSSSGNSALLVFALASLQGSARAMPSSSGSFCTGSRTD
jgi:hypothetical protein